MLASRRSSSQETPAEAPPVTERRWSHWILRGAALLVVGYLVVLAAMNVLLRRAMARLATGDSRVECEHAYTWIPGEIELRGIVLAPRGAPFTLGAESARLSLDLSELLLKQRLLVRRLTAPLDTLTLKHSLLHALPVGSGRLQLRDGMQLRVNDLRRANGAWRTRSVQLDLARTRLESGAGVTSWVQGEVHLEDRIARLALNGKESEAATQPGWSLQGALNLSQDRLTVPEGITLLAEQSFSWTHQRRSIRFSRGSRLSIDATPSAPMMAQLEFPQVVLEASAGSGEVALKAEWLRLDYVHPDVVGQATLPLRVRASAVSIELDTDSVLGRVRSPLSATLALERREGWQIVGGRIELGKVVPAEGTEIVPLAVRLLPERMALSPEGLPEIAARLELEGEQLATFLDVLELPEAATLVAAPFREQPFRAHARLTRRADLLELENIELHSHGILAQGFLYQKAGSRRGALVFEAPLGAVGVSLEGGSVRASWRPDPKWLTRERARLTTGAK